MVYFIQAGENGPIKIGYTKNPQDRLAQLQMANPYELKLLWYENGDHCDEDNLHDRFKHERIRGEWFHPSRELLEFISQRHEELEEIVLPYGVVSLEHTPSHIGVSCDDFFVYFNAEKVEISTDAFLITIDKDGKVSYGQWE